MEPIPVGDIDRIHDECLSLPSADGVPHPQVVRILRMSAPVRIDLAPATPKKHDGAALNLNDLHRSLHSGIEARHAVGKATIGGIVRILLRMRSEGRPIAFEFLFWPSLDGRLISH